MEADFLQPIGGLNRTEVKVSKNLLSLLSVFQLEHQPSGLEVELTPPDLLHLRPSDTD
jgi:hypothetical protein